MNQTVTGQPITKSSTRKRSILLVGLLIGLAVMVILGLSAFTGTPLYTARELLSSSGASYTPNRLDATTLNDSHGARVASVEFLLPSGVLASSDNRFTMMVSVWHTSETHLDSFDLTLSSPFAGTSLDVWLLPPSGGDPMQITNYGTKTTIHFANLAFHGVGTVGYDLLIQTFPFPRDSNYQLNLDGEITLHYTNYLFTQHAYFAQVSRQFMISPNGTITQSG